MACSKADVGIWVLRPPRADLSFIIRGVLHAILCCGMFPHALAFSLPAGTTAIFEDVENGEYLPSLNVFECNRKIAIVQFWIIIVICHDIFLLTMAERVPFAGWRLAGYTNYDSCLLPVLRSFTFRQTELGHRYFGSAPHFIPP